MALAVVFNHVDHHDDHDQSAVLAVVVAMLADLADNHRIVQALVVLARVRAVVAIREDLALHQVGTQAGVCNRLGQTQCRSGSYVSSR